ncbi:hypothetical protein ASPZODRAFT_129060 [Penicilliopsis zonata CBS 506.65]|uniref:Pyrroline-5-carboxylate reductase n=1 Tax=Penicilliopsis zonata CBS 506.65 TaxID=1073090 RepID=A0A1L9ST99_9EURO|nr:hypothetical protein ASPZODRAFT_129060 [Penicilliopsis zonata CBS 506.65]OJJ50430.1 hypothetical protein ASPZODRAFT_129060 [Penicilliopsis zonata CBS 506.65]
MAMAIVRGLITHGLSAQSITVAEPWEVNRGKMAEMGVQTTTDNVAAVRGADVVILAVKPQVTKAVCQEIAAGWSGAASPPVVVSIAAGITLASLQQWLHAEGGKSVHVVRVMPNTPALVSEGASGLVAGEGVTEDEKALIDGLLRSVSKATEWVDREDLLDVVTGLSGSGPAYFFAMVEHLIASATALGLSKEQATRLAAQTCLGAGKMLVESSDEPAQLRRNVTSPGGTTFAALQTFEALKFGETVDAAVKSATARAAELGETLGKQ